MPRERLRQVLVLRYLYAVIAVAAAAGLRALSSGVGDARAPYLPFVIAVIVAATFGGLGPGLLSMALSAITAAWWPVPGEERFSGTMADWTNLALFLGPGSSASRCNRWTWRP